MVNKAIKEKLVKLFSDYRQYKYLKDQVLTEKQIRFCKEIESSVERLPVLERFLIEERYLSADAEYLTDYQVYSFKFQPPISHVTHTKIRKKAFEKLALRLRITDER